MTTYDEYYESHYDPTYGFAECCVCLNPIKRGEKWCSNKCFEVDEGKQNETPE